MAKLLQINTVIDYGSTGKIVEKVGELAIKNGWVSYVAYGRKARPSKSILIRAGNYLGIFYHVLLTRMFDKHGFGSQRSTRILINEIKKIDPDIIHIHNLHGYYLNIEVLFNYLATLETPVVWTFHDCWPITGHCAHFDYAGCNRWKNECYKCCQKSGYPASYLVDRSTKNFHLKKKLFTSLKSLTIVPVSSWLAGIVKQSFLSEIPICVINNGIDLSTFYPLNSDKIKTKYNPKNKFIILGVASVWNSRKGFSNFINLSERLDDNSLIILIGLEKKQIHGLPNNVLGIRRTENVQELAAYYNMADVYFNASKEETFGLTVVEAMACGVPSIVYNSTASPELITENTGLVIEKDNIEDLLNAISIIKSRGKDYYSKACRERAEKFYDKNDRFMDYIRLYESLLSKK